MMKRSESIKDLATALAKAQAKIEGASKDHTATVKSDKANYQYKYATLAGVWDAARQPLADNGLSIVQSIAADGPKVTVTTLLMHASGEWIESELTMIASRVDPQGIGSASTYGRRYSLAAIVGVCQEDDDGTAVSQPKREEPVKSNGNGHNAPASTPSTAKPDPVALLNLKLKQAGCKNAEMANALCSHCSNAAYPTVDAARASDATATKMLELLDEARRHFEWTDLLADAMGGTHANAV